MPPTNAPQYSFIAMGMKGSLIIAPRHVANIVHMTIIAPSVVTEPKPPAFLHPLFSVTESFLKNLFIRCYSS